jgi:hypothetical protein
MQVRPVAIAMADFMPFGNLLAVCPSRNGQFHAGRIVLFVNDNSMHEFLYVHLD